MIVLALDTALSTCSVAIIRGPETLFDRFTFQAKGHAETLPPMAAAALSETGLIAADIDRIGVVVGPGQFTGVRVGLAFARGFALGRPNAIVGVNSLRALRDSAAIKGWIAPVVDARRGEVFAGLYDADGDERLQPFAAAPDAAAMRIAEAAGDADAICLLGSGAGLLPSDARFYRADTKSLRGIDPVAVARIAAEAPPPAGPPGPIYLRAPDAKKSAAALLAGAMAIPGGIRSESGTTDGG